MAELSLDDAIACFRLATERRIAAEQVLEARLAAGELPITDDGLDLRDNLFTCEFVELAAASQVVCLRAQQGVSQK